MQKIICVLLYKCHLYPVLDTEISDDDDDDDADLVTLPCIENEMLTNMKCLIAVIIGPNDLLLLLRCR